MGALEDVELLDDSFEDLSQSQFSEEGSVDDESGEALFAESF